MPSEYSDDLPFSQTRREKTGCHALESVAWQKGERPYQEGLFQREMGDDSELENARGVHRRVA